MTTPANTTGEETTRYPETVGDGDDQADTRQLAPETEEPDADEAGYGYGV